LFKAERSLLRAEPWWSMVFGAPLFVRALLRLVFLCPHWHKGPPITLRELIPSTYRDTGLFMAEKPTSLVWTAGKNSLTTTMLLVSFPLFEVSLQGLAG
jgi:hypothetical protein